VHTAQPWFDPSGPRRAPPRGLTTRLVAVRLDALETEPTYNPVSQIVYATGRHQVSDVWIAGVHKVENGNVIGIDTDALREKARSWRDRIGAYRG